MKGTVMRKVKWLLLCLLLSGCGSAKMTEWFRETPSPHPAPPGQPAPPPTREVTRTVEATKGLVWTDPSAGEVLSHVNAMKLPAEGGVEFEGMEAFALARKGPIILICAGIAIAGIGALIAWFIPLARTTGILTMGGGGVLILAGIVFEWQPLVALAMLGAVVLGGLAWFIWGTAAGAKMRGALANVVSGVEATKKQDPAAAKMVTTNIAVAAGGTKGKAATVAVDERTKKGL